MDAVAEVKSRLNIEDVISGYVELKRAGRNFKGLSPFSNERTPSFVVSPEKQIWHDFSSNRGGDMFSFIMEVEGLDFRATLEMLALKAGVDLEEFQGSNKRSNTKLKARVHEALELATRFYQKQLIASKPALEYLRTSRGFSKDTILTWRLGYSPNNGSAVTDFLIGRGFTQEELKTAGLSTQRRGGWGDMFRERIMVPLADPSGQIIGFTARLLNDVPNAPKYINTPQSPVYDKSRHVYGLHLAKERIRKDGFVIVVEGNLDVIASNQAGVTNVVASAGTAITEMHLKALKRFTGDIRLSFDSDRAGLTAVERAIPLAQNVGVSLRIISIEDAKDPDELIKKDVKLWQAAIDNASYATDWLMDRYAAELDLGSAQGKRQFTDAVLTTIRRLNDPVEKEHYVKKVAEITSTSADAVTAKLSQQAAPETIRRKVVKPPPQLLDKDVIEYLKLQDHFLAMTLMQPKTRKFLSSVKPELLTDGPQRQVYEFLVSHPDFNGDKATASQLQQIGDYVKIITLQFEELYQDLTPRELEHQAAQLKDRLIDKFVKMQKHLLAVEMGQTTDEKELGKLMQKADRLNQLINK